MVGAMLLAGVPAARAGAPLVTDDAAVVAAKSCQLEAWFSATANSREGWFVPACNFTGQTELSIGLVGISPDIEPNTRQVQFQAKAALSRPEDQWWSIGFVAGIARDTGSVPEGASSRAYYGKALLSLYPSEALEIDVNLGAANDFGAGTTTVGGVALQYEIVTRTTLFGEVFRDERGPGKYQVGTRYAFVPERFEAYASYGNRLGRSSDDGWWATVGIRINTSAFLP